MSVTHERTLDGIPIEQAICKKKLRPGSGFLSVGITTDGPTRVLQISDSKNKASFQCYKASQGMTVGINHFFANWYENHCFIFLDGKICKVRGKRLELNQ